MAEALVKLFQKRLNSLLMQNPEVFTVINGQILHLKSRLDEIGGFAQDSDTAKYGDEMVRKWQSRLRETIYGVEDCIDQFIIQVKTQDGSDKAPFIFHCETELVKFNAHLSEILNSRPQFRIPASSTGDESLALFASNYVKLPYYLRSCLMYCCTFPMKHSRIHRGRLVRLWVAEGLVQEEPGKVLEDVAEEYVEKLVSLGMLEKVVRCEIKFKVPHLYRESLLHEMLEEGFLITSSESEPNIHPPARCVSFHTCVDKEISNFNNPSIRSLLILGIKYEFDDHWDCPKSVFHGFKFLRVLNLEELQIEKLPNEVGNLIHLTLLSLKHSKKIKELPESIGNLHNLLTLDIRWCGSISSLPNGILNVVHLRNLLMFKNSHVCGIKLPIGIGRLTNLQSIKGIYAGGNISRELGELTQLRELGVMDFSEDHNSELSASIMNMRGLLSLSLKSTGIDDDLLPNLEPFAPPPLLRKLQLEGRLVGLPDWLSSAENLTKLRLGFSHLSENPTSILQSLPNLKHLTLWQAYNAKRIGKDFCQVGGFPKLEALVIASYNLVEWTEIEEGAFPSLKYLHFHNCSRLMTLPEGLQYVTTLQDLRIYSLHGDLARRLLPEGAENYKIKHILKVFYLL